MRKRYWWDRAARDGKGDWVEQQPRRGKLGVMVISDSMEPTLNPADGRRYDSKRAYYRGVREAGCEIVGNERLRQHVPQHVPQGVGQDVKRAIEQLGG